MMNHTRLAGKKQRIFGFDLVRAVCALGIVAYHFSGHLASVAYRPFYAYQNGTWGMLLVPAFFALSGASIVINNPQIPSLRSFYYKRWKALFPMFYLAFSFYYLQNVWAIGTPFYMGRPHTLLLTLIGMDGLLLYKIPNYYILGEWFLGAIILMYILYPAYLWLQKRFPKVTFWVALGLFLVQVFVEKNRYDEWGFVAVQFAFVMGMYIGKYGLYANKKLCMAAAAVALVILAVPLPIPDTLANRVGGIALFLGLCGLGEVLDKKVPQIKPAVMELSRLSYALFLIHHRLILQIMVGFQPITPVKTIVLCILSIGASLVWAKGLYILNQAIVTSKPFLRFERWVTAPWPKRFRKKAS